jgi:hypothetical protein
LFGSIQGRGRVRKGGPEWRRIFLLNICLVQKKERQGNIF